MSTEIFGLDTPSLAGSLELLGIDSEKWRVRKSGVKDSPAMLERDVYFSGGKPFSWSCSDPGEPAEVAALRDNYIHLWSRDAVYYLAAFNPLLGELNDVEKSDKFFTEAQKYRGRVADFFKGRYQKMHSSASYDKKYATPLEDGVGVLLEGFALGGEASKESDVTRSIEIFVKRRPGQRSFARLLEANKNYWKATRANPDKAPTILAKAFENLGISAEDANTCVGLNMLEAIAARSDQICASGEYNTSFDIAMIHMFKELDDRQDVLLKWLVPHMFALQKETYQPTAAPEVVAFVPKESKPPKARRVIKVIKQEFEAKPAEEPPVISSPVYEAPPPPPPPPSPPLAFQKPEQKWKRPKAYGGEEVEVK
ncbi:MAG: hypothetical protein Q7T03_10330 [Deltaproteobacteria bacterium]|nr:hypothetical protein [Deltaproteobacteria bacterium]